MELVLEAVLWLAVEVFGEVFFEILVELGLATLKSARGRENRGAIAASAGYLLLGALLGGLSALLLPRRVLPGAARRGMSLFLAPFAGGLAMAWWGGLRRAQGRPTTNLATWYGGGAFAFGLALARWLLVG